jgi:hypothetical protein
MKRRKEERCIITVNIGLTQNTAPARHTRTAEPIHQIGTRSAVTARHTRTLYKTKHNARVSKQTQHKKKKNGAERNCSRPLMLVWHVLPE